MQMGRQKIDKDAVEEGEIGDRWIFLRRPMRWCEGKAVKG